MKYHTLLGRASLSKLVLQLLWRHSRLSDFGPGGQGSISNRGTVDKHFSPVTFGAQRK